LHTPVLRLALGARIPLRLLLTRGVAQVTALYKLSTGTGKKEGF
jgi:hypothetical protein